MVEVKQVAKWFIDHNKGIRSTKLGHLKLQKLVYISNALYITKYDTALIEYPFEAWDNGPVCVPLYHDFRNSGVEGYADINGSNFSEAVLAVLKMANNHFGFLAAEELVEFTHNQMAWQKAHRNKVIEKELIKQDYADILADLEYMDDPEADLDCLIIKGYRFIYDKKEIFFSNADYRQLYNFINNGGEVGTYQVYRDVKTKELVIF